MLRFVAHEARHSYQWDAYNNPGRYIVSNRTMDIWRVNFTRLVPQGAFANGFPQPAHMRSPIEWDAYYFTDQISSREFNRLFGRPDYYLGWYSPWPH